MLFRPLVLVILSCVFASSFAANIILSPKEGKNGDPIGLIYVIGANLAPDQYVALCETLQDAFPQPLYVAIPDFFYEFATDKQLESEIPGLLLDMESKGLPKKSSIFLAGHSLGGAAVEGLTGTYQLNYTKISPDWVFRGQMLNAAFITRKWRNQSTQIIEDYAIPTLTIGGELDGNLHVSRMVEQYYTQLMKTAHSGPFVDNATMLHLPVIIVMGMNHMQYATGNVPKNVLDKDLMAELEDTSARSLVTDYMSCWMSLILDNGQCHFDLIYGAVTSALPFVTPFVAAFMLEGSYWFHPPCDCSQLICTSSDLCQAGSPWMDDVVYPTMNEWIPQRIMCGFGDQGNASIKVQHVNTDSFHPTWQVHPFHYANIWNNCSSSHDAECTLNTSTVTQNIYPLADKPDTGGHSTSAIEMRHKMKSRQACYEAINAGDVDEDLQICSAINQHSIEWALRNAPSRTLERYYKYGEAIAVGEDVEAGSGVTWTWQPLKEHRMCNPDTHKYHSVVQSIYVYLHTEKSGHCELPSFLPKTECGVHYCKVLSPAHVMEWLYTDSLRFNLSIANVNQTVNVTCTPNEYKLQDMF